MGIIAESMVEYAQPLLDDTDGSHEQIQTAMSIAQMCWNLALMPESEQGELLDKMRPSLGMDDSEFAEFRKSVVAPMIARHREMFPLMAKHGIQALRTGPSRSAKKYPGTGRNEPCPCNSGNKYKRCCGR